MSSGKSTHGLKSAGRPKGDTTPNTVLAKKLQAVCGSKKYSEISSLFGVSGVAVSRYLTGKKVPVAAALAHFHRETHVDLNWLLDDADDREGPVFVRKRKRSSGGGET